MAAQIKEYLENALRQNVNIQRDDEMTERLPLVYQGRYDIYKVETNGAVWMIIHPKIDVGLVNLRKDRSKIEKMHELNGAIYFDKTTFYIKEKLLQEGVPFVIDKKTVFLPFLGYLLGNDGERKLPPVHLISFLAQKMLILSIYERWNEVKVSVAARKLNVSVKSASRCFDELEYLDIGVIALKGKYRVITVPKDIKALWDSCTSVLRDPVIRRFELSEDIKLDKMAGISALCEYSLLSDNRYPTYAVTKRELGKTQVKEVREVTVGEEIRCIVLELGYFIDFEGKGIQDPLSVSLSVTTEEKTDERIAMSVKKMLEDHVWSRA